jgi:glycosyltransferase involved in cell wall biosynthesis
MLTQLASGVEVVVLDCGSKDDTQKIVSQYASRYDCLRYINQGQNNGIDRDFDRAVELARGQYCWLMTDDDVLKEGAVASVLKVINRNPSLIIVNAEIRSFNMSQVLQSRWLNIPEDRAYAPEETEQLVIDTSNILKFIGCVVIKRSIWIERARKQYYGSLFIYLGVIFQERLPGEAVVIAEPVLSYRAGNTHTFSSRVIEIVYVKYPALVSSLPFSDKLKRSICSAEPWRRWSELLLWRGLGVYSISEYRRWVRPAARSLDGMGAALIALVPGVIVNALLVIYYSVRNRRRMGEPWQPAVLLYALKESPFNWNRRSCGRGSGVEPPLDPCGE